MNESRIYGLLGLCQKAGRLLSGDMQIRDGLKKKKGCLFLIAADSSEQTRKTYIGMAEAIRIPWLIIGSKEELGRAIGKGQRTAVLITDAGFAKAVRTRIE